MGFNQLIKWKFGYNLIGSKIRNIPNITIIQINNFRDTQFQGMLMWLIVSDRHFYPRLHGKCHYKVLQ